jgi:transposase InsO family protein
MTTTPQRQHIAHLITEACQSGARLHRACKQIGMTCRTLQRWLRPDAKAAAEALAPELAQQQQEPQANVDAEPTLARAPQLPPAPLTVALQPGATAPIAVPATPAIQGRPIRADHRQTHLRCAVTPHNKLTPQECDALLAVANSELFKDLPPSQIVPRLADQGIYLGSESTLQRLLRSRQQNTHRRSTRAAVKRHKPFALRATMVNQVYTWDITYLPTTIKGQYFYLYVFVDIFSRFIVGAQAFESESADLAGQLLKDICQRHGVGKDQVHLHSDNGSPMKGQTMLAMMNELGVMASRSRPSVSNDNPYSESLFATLKYRPLMPVKPFETIEQARLWAIGLVDWYNQEHRHSGIKFVTPEQRHLGQDVQLLQRRDALYAAAREKNPNRWSCNTRNWSRVTEVHLNPDKPEVKESNQPQK